ncbi:MAG TPA: hypothetical protein VGS57_15625 [Thermoanaerobaculia bacterium]|nr:hypothetical protein [Thermoanaerobaculia bacterium]
MRDELYASPPRQFNDWFDCRASIDSNGTKSEWLRYWNHVGSVLGLTGRAKARFASEAVKSEGWRDAAKHQAVKDGIQANLDNSGVICLTETPLNRRMWDEYAGAGKGICLCLETFGSPFEEMLDVQYLPTHPTVRFDATSDELVEAFLLAKTEPYRWEREWRKVYFKEGGGPKPIPASSLRAVLLGPAIATSDRQDILNCLAKWKPSVFVLEVQDTAAGFVLGPVVHGRIGHDLMPPIKEWVEPEPEGKTDLARLVEQLASIADGDRDLAIDVRLRWILENLDVHLAAQERRGATEAAGVRLALREARNLFVDLVDSSGSARTGYGPIAILLYRLVRNIEVALPPGVEL